MAHRAQYQGKNLFRLLLALVIPVLLLYLRIVFGIAAGRTGITTGQHIWLLRAANIALGAFFLAEIISARYVQKRLPPPKWRVAQVLQYVGVFILCSFGSLCAAVLLEGFGYNFLLRS